MEAESLFTQNQDFDPHEPLASRMRPRTIAEYIGQDHILGPGRLLRRAIQADQLSSLIFSGPPGTGKTTLARVIANSTKSYFLSLNAVLAGVKEIREAISQAQERKSLYNRRTILFVDEVHRWNKSQQDALLPWVENGTIVLIGATTENPFFEVNRALVSRSRIFQLQPLGTKDLQQIMEQTLNDKIRGFGNRKITLEPKAENHLVSIADGDARSLLNALELAVETTEPDAETGEIHITLDIAEESIQQKAILYDKEGDYHFDTISAFIKSLRGSDPDAALFWMARMIKAGESPRFIFRRMLISASEDIGLADPQALGIVEAAASAFERVGLPEGQFFLTQAAIYLSTAPKSNSALGYFDALKSLDEDPGEVPNHLKDPSRDKHGFGHGQGYKYPHAFAEHWVAQDYLPASLKGKIFYQPGNQGWEAEISQKVQERREIQLSLAVDVFNTESLTYSPEIPGLENWIKRTDQLHAEHLIHLRSKLFEIGNFSRSDRILVFGNDGLPFLWQSLRTCPEGLSVGIFPNPHIKKIAEDHTLFLELNRKPHIFPSLQDFTTWNDDSIVFDGIVGRGLLQSNQTGGELNQLQHHIASKGTVLSLDINPSKSGQLTPILETLNADRDLVSLTKKCEKALVFPEPRMPEGFSQTAIISLELMVERRITSEDIARWVPGKNEQSLSPFYLASLQTLDLGEREKMKQGFTQVLLGSKVHWKMVYDITTLSLSFP